MFAFGSGVLLGTRTDVANATPVNFGLVQEVQLDLQFTAKELYGQYQFPVAIARGQGKATGKAKMAQISGLAFNNLFFGGDAGERPARDLFRRGRHGAGLLGLYGHGREFRRLAGRLRRRLCDERLAADQGRRAARAPGNTASPPASTPSIRRMRRKRC